METNTEERTPIALIKQQHMVEVMPKVALRSVIYWLAVCGVLLGGCKRQPQEEQRGSPSSEQESRRQAPAPDNYFQTHFQDESQFIVESVLMDVAEMAAYAQTTDPTKPSEISVAATERPDSQFRLPSYDVKIRTG